MIWFFLYLFELKTQISVRKAVNVPVILFSLHQTSLSCVFSVALQKRCTETFHSSVWIERRRFVVSSSDSSTKILFDPPFQHHFIFYFITLSLIQWFVPNCNQASFLCVNNEQPFVYFCLWFLWWCAVYCYVENWVLSSLLYVNTVLWNVTPAF